VTPSRFLQFLVNLREIIPVLIACSYLCPSALAQRAAQNPSQPEIHSDADAHDFSKTVIPISNLKFRFGVEVALATGFCLDPACRFIGTNYHFAARERPHQIKGQEVIQRYLATGPDDEGATVNSGPSMSPLKYTLSRDLAIFELRRPVPHYHGDAYSLGDLEVGQEVDIYAYPKESINPFRRLLQFNGSFKGTTTTGLLAFDYSLSGDKMIRPGASGGIVVDRKTQRIVGILSSIALNGEAIALAVPVQSLVEFLSKAQPYLAQNLFPSKNRISPLSADLYPKFLTSPVPADLSPKFLPSRIETLQRRPEEPAEVKLLRQKAQLLANNMRNFIAVQTLAWGSGDKEPIAEAAYEVRVVNGDQQFREYPDGKKELRSVPFPRLNESIVPGDEWSELPEMVGTKLRLKIHQAPDVVVDEHRMKVFQYRADVEDGVCGFRFVDNYIFFELTKDVIVSCYGEVWTDEETNILRMSEHLELRGNWKEFQAVVTYGWLKRADSSPQLIPLTISTQMEHNNKIHWCRGMFTDYRMFDTRARIIGN
jgi:hypothetical protein